MQTPSEVAWLATAQQLRKILQTKAAKLTVNRDDSHVRDDIIAMSCQYKYLGNLETFNVTDNLPEDFLSSLSVIRPDILTHSFSAMWECLEESVLDTIDTFLAQRDPQQPRIRTFVDYICDDSGPLATSLQKAVSRNVPISAFQIQLGVVVVLEARQGIDTEIFRSELSLKKGLALKVLLNPAELVEINKMASEAVRLAAAKTITFREFI